MFFLLKGTKGCLKSIDFRHCERSEAMTEY